MQTNAKAGFRDESTNPGPAVKSVTPADWLIARQQLLQKEKALTRLQDEVARARAAMPWEKVDKTYTFNSPDGQVTLADLFEGRRQLIVQHFMFGPDDTEGCPGCSLSADSIDGAAPHLENNDISIVAVSRAPLSKLNAYKKRMGWHFNWVSSAQNDFNYDYNVSWKPADLAKGNITYNYAVIENPPPDMGDLPGVSVFYKEDNGDIYHTYSTFARGGEFQAVALRYFEIAPLGRSPLSLEQWIRRHDSYTTPKAASSCCSSKQG